MKKQVSFCLAMLLCIALATPVFAYEQKSDPCEYLPMNLQEYGDAYIDFTIQMEDLGCCVNICIEDFASGYQKGDFSSVDEYIRNLIAVEIATNQSKTNIICSNIISDQPDVAIASTNVASEMWYDNIGYLTPTFTDEAIDNISYSDNYNLLNIVQKGDIVIETNGTIAHYTGHAALVQGIYYSSSISSFYIRTIEAGVDGVVYGVLDDNRFYDRGVRVYYVRYANEVQINDAIIFAGCQLGKGYNWSAVLSRQGYCKTGINEYPWYCTELVWAAYNWTDGEAGGININQDGTIPENIYMPLALATSNMLARRV